MDPIFSPDELELPGFERGIGASPTTRMQKPGWTDVPSTGGLLAPYARMLRLRDERKAKGIKSPYELFEDKVANCQPDAEACDGAARVFVSVDGREHCFSCDKKHRGCKVGRAEYVEACKRVINELGYAGEYDKACFEHPAYIRDSDLSRRSMQYATGDELPGGRSLIIVGGVGPGKTLNALAIAAHAAVALGYRVKASTARRLLNHREGGVKDLEEAMRVRLLVIDDLGLENITEYTQGNLLEVIDRRIGQGFPTLITTNMATDAMKARYSDERLLDRLKRFRVFTTAEKSRR